MSPEKTTKKSEPLTPAEALADAEPAKPEPPKQDEKPKAQPAKTKSVKYVGKDRKVRRTERDKRGKKKERWLKPGDTFTTTEKDAGLLCKRPDFEEA